MNKLGDSFEFRITEEDYPEDDYSVYFLEVKSQIRDAWFRIKFSPDLQEIIDYCADNEINGITI